MTLPLQLFRAVAMGLFGWLVDGILLKEGWRSALMDCGGQCVMVDGITMMQQLCADNWGFLWVCLAQVLNT